jgi:hypothetical protein
MMNFKCKTDNGQCKTEQRGERAVVRAISAISNAKPTTDNAKRGLTVTGCQLSVVSFLLKPM